MPLSLPNTYSALVLVGANLVPLIGAIFYHWDPKLVLALFWIENLIIGAFTLLKMVSLIVYKSQYRRAFVCLFFVLHYGLFCSVHGLLLWDLLDLGELPDYQFVLFSSVGILELFAEGASLAMGFIDRFQNFIWFGVSALLLSHGVSFIENFILRGELFKQRVNSLMTQPYAQIVAMHAGLILGAVALEKLGSPVWLLVIIVLLKLNIDFMQYQRRRKKALTEQIKDI